MTAALMVQGASSSAGKSRVVTALARYFSRLGRKVVPFSASPPRGSWNLRPS